MPAATRWRSALFSSGFARGRAVALSQRFLWPASSASQCAFSCRGDRPDHSILDLSRPRAGDGPDLAGSRLRPPNLWPELRRAGRGALDVLSRGPQLPGDRDDARRDTGAGRYSPYCAYASMRNGSRATAPRKGEDAERWERGADDLPSGTGCGRCWRPSTWLSAMSSRLSIRP